MFSAFKKGDWLKLKGITRHGKNRIHQHGEWWEVNTVGTFEGFTAVLLNSRNETFAIRGRGNSKEEWKTTMIHDQRWVHIKEDKNFQVVAHAVSH